MIRLFTGWDGREAVGWHTFVQSVIDRTPEPVAFIPIGSQLTERDGTNAFTYSRFLVPWLCDFEGFALFVDGADMLARASLAELWNLRSEMSINGYAVMVAKHNYESSASRKYIGTNLESANQNYPRKNWSSVVLWNCSHYGVRRLTPDWIRKQGGADLQRFNWLEPSRIGELPLNWNALVGEVAAVDECKLAHFTLGLPGFEHYRACEFADEWRATLGRALAGLQTHKLGESQ